MTANINTKSGIAFGYISANALNSDTVNELLYGPQAVNVTYREALNEYLGFKLKEHDEEQDEQLIAHAERGEDREGTDFEEEDFDEEAAAEEFSESYQCEEETIEGEMECPGYANVVYCTSYLGGALNFFIASSPFTTDKARRASPCVPNCGILDTLDGSVTSYDVPADWRREE